VGCVYAELVREDRQKTSKKLGRGEEERKLVRREITLQCVMEGDKRPQELEDFPQHVSWQTHIPLILLDKHSPRPPCFLFFTHLW
jgi:hypothetical protein